MKYVAVRTDHLKVGTMQAGFGRGGMEFAVDAINGGRAPHLCWWPLEEGDYDLWWVLDDEEGDQTTWSIIEWPELEEPE